VNKISNQIRFEDTSLAFVVLKVSVDISKHLLYLCCYGFYKCITTAEHSHLKCVCCLYLATSMVWYETG